MKNKQTSQQSQSQVLIEIANAYQENGIYEQDLKIENSCECDTPEPDEWDNLHGDIFLFI